MLLGWVESGVVSSFCGAVVAFSVRLARVTVTVRVVPSRTTSTGTCWPD